MRWQTVRPCVQLGQYYIMNKCEHGQKISNFCASECCVWRQAAGCDTCMKKYHNHMGPTIFLNQSEVAALLKKYTLDSSLRPKCRLLQQAIYSYFNLLKTQITNSIDTVCKNAVTQIGYPYLHNNSTLSTYKRLKNKEYKKIVQKEFRNLYELSQRVTEEEVATQESRIYAERVKCTEELLDGIEGVMKGYEAVVKKNMAGFGHDRNYFARVQELLRAIDAQSQGKSSKSKANKESDSKPEILISQPKQKGSPQAKKQGTVNNENTPLRIPIISIAPPPLLSKPNYARNVSIDKKLDPFNARLRDKSRELSRKEENKPAESKGEELNNREIEINEKKRMLMEMMNVKNVKQKSNAELIEKKEPEKVSLGVPSYFKRQYSERSPNGTKAHQAEKSQQVESNVKQLTYQSDQNSHSHNDIEQEQNGSKHDQNYVEQQAFTKLPLLDQDLAEAADVEQVKEKVIVISNPKELEDLGNNYEKTNSPLLLKKSLSTPRQKEDNKEEEAIEANEKDASACEETLQLKENQEKSLALLLKSLTLNAEEATKYLESSLHEAENNLSAAEYLSFLYLEQDKPQNCLHLCNKMLEKLQASPQPDERSLLLSNNKAAALNILGRYSESIVILQRCLKYREKDFLFKNLADAYFSISIYEKAIYNYEKALKLNQNYDEAHYNLAVCLYIQENYFNAKLAIRKALDLQPQNPKYLELLFHIETRITHC